MSERGRGRRGWLLAIAALAACEATPGEQAATGTSPPLPLGLVLFSLDFVAGQRTGLPARTQITLVLGEDAQRRPGGAGGQIVRTLAGPGRLSGADLADGERALTRFFAVNLPARPHAVGRLFVEPNDGLLNRTTFILPPLVFTPIPGRALYLGNIAILPHTWTPTREPNIQPSSHRAWRDMAGRDMAALRASTPGLAGLAVDAWPRPVNWPSGLPPRAAWPDGNRAVRPGEGPAPPQFYGAPGQPLAPPGTPVRQYGQPAPPPGFGPPGVAPGRFGRGAAQ